MMLQLLRSANSYVCCYMLFIHRFWKMCKVFEAFEVVLKHLNSTVLWLIVSFYRGSLWNEDRNDLKAGSCFVQQTLSFRFQFHSNFIISSHSGLMFGLGRAGRANGRQLVTLIHSTPPRPPLSSHLPSTPAITGIPTAIQLPSVNHLCFSPQKSFFSADLKKI